jgi:hypothetical protein
LCNHFDIVPLNEVSRRMRSNPRPNKYGELIAPSDKQ